MIGRLNGIIIEKKPPLLLLEVGGVGYEILASMTTFYHLPEISERIILLTHLIVREDAHLLYGFLREEERHLFRTLIKVNGIGPKLALTILSGIETESFVRCIREHDTSRLVNIPGIGKKTAERLVIEMHDALSNWSCSLTSSTPMTENQQFQDAVSALAALGYKPHEAKQALSKVQQKGHNRETLIRLALKYILEGK